jgi:hypothetical protein
LRLVLVAEVPCLFLLLAEDELVVKRAPWCCRVDLVLWFFGAVVKEKKEGDSCQKGKRKEIYIYTIYTCGS